MNDSLDGRVALVTGATGGIGGAIAQELYNCGASVMMTGRDPQKLADLRVKYEIDGSNKNGRVATLGLDLTAIDAAKTLVSRTVERFGKLDILVHAAARIISPKLLFRTTNSDLDAIMHTNFTVAYNLCHNALPVMTKNKFGRIINITSVAGCMGDAGISLYAASKGALSSLTKSIAVEFARRGITANCVAPGMIDTDAMKVLTADKKAKFKEMIPMSRFGKPDEVAYLVAFLASERAAYITGQEICINGGLTR